VLDFLSRVWRRQKASAPSSKGSRPLFHSVAPGDIAQSKDAALRSHAPSANRAPASSPSLLPPGALGETASLEAVLPDGSPSPLMQASEELGVNANSRELGERVVKGAGLVMFSAISMQLLGVVRTVVLARLLSLDSFGLAAMTLTVSGALYTLTNTGVIASVISERFDDERELHSYANLLWTIEAARGVTIAAFILLGAWPFAHFYHEPRLFPILLVMALQPLSTALTNIGLPLQERRLHLKRVTLHGALTNTVTVVATLAIAIATHNYWAIIWGQVLGAFTSTAFSYWFSSYRPRLEWHLPLARRAFDFGKHQFVIGISNYVLTTMDNVLVGFTLGTISLGIYSVAYSFCTMARQVASAAFGNVLFPAFAAAGREDDPARLRSLVERAFTLGMAGLSLFLVPLIVYSPAIMRIFFPRFGVTAVEPMRWLLVAGWFSGLLSLFSSFFVGLGRPAIESKFKVLDAVVFVAVLVPLTHLHGVVGAAQAGAITWALASIWRLRAGNSLAPGAFARLPSLTISSVLVGAGATVVGLWPFARTSIFSLGGFERAFHPVPPSLGTAWLQLLVGAPLLALLCAGGLMALHPVARTQMPALARKLLGRR